MPIDDDYLEELIRRWSQTVKAIPVKDWSNDDFRTRVERLRRRRRRWRVLFIICMLVLAAGLARVGYVLAR